MRALGREPDRHEWLEYDDGALSDVPLADLVARVAAILEEESPDVVATFGPDGITGHPDHIRIGAATDAAFHRCRERAGSGFRRLVHGAMPESVFARWRESRRRRGLAAWDPSTVYHPRGVPDETIGITVDVSEVADRVVAGLRQHRSQQHVIADDGLTDEAWARSASREHLVVAWPEMPVGSARLASVFEGLD